MPPYRNKVLFLGVLAGCIATGVLVVEQRRGAVPFVRRGNEWSIGIYSGRSPLSLLPDHRVSNPVLAARDVTDVRAEFVADPFMIRESDTWHMFFEVFNSATRQGDIGLATSRDGTTWDYQQIVLDEAFHLSYPYAFSFNGQYYMVPESYEAQSIRLYQADRFPTRWSLVKVLVQCNDCVDSSVFQYQGRWWMFTSSTSHDILRLFVADSLLGPWVEHPRSPVVRQDANIARPGGRVLVMNGSVFRLAQDDKPTYGNQLRVFEITRLTETAYVEREAKQSPILKASGRRGWNKDGMHHADVHRIGPDAWIACVDGNRQHLQFGFSY